MSEDLLNKINSSTFHQISNLQITINDNTILVEGQCKSFYVKQLATHTVLHFNPKSILINNVEVNNEIKKT